MKRIVCLLLAIACTLPLLVACGKQTKLEIVSEGACNIIYDDTQLTEDQAQNFANRIKKAIGVTATVVAASSFVREVQAKANTVLLGSVAVDACRSATADLRYLDYVVGVYDTVYVIAGPSTAATLNAMQYFLEEVLPDDGKEHSELTVSSKHNYRYEGDYRISGMSIGGVPLASCEIVVPNEASASEYRFAVQLRELLVQRTGCLLSIVKLRKAKAEGQIRIGASICADIKLSSAHGYEIGVWGKTLEIAAGSLYGYAEARSAFQDEILGAKKEEYPLADTVRLSGDGAARATEPLVHTGEVRLFFNNVWNGSTGDTTQRAGMLAELYTAYMPDVIGLQECSPAMRNAGISALLSAGYAEVPISSYLVHYGNEGLPRTPLYYRTDTLELLEKGYEDYHDLPFDSEEYEDLLLHGVTSRDMRALMDQDKYGPDEDASKGVTWAIFRVKATGHVFLAASTHLWWQGRDLRDDSARVIQMAVMKAMLVKTAADFMSKNGLVGEMPIFVGGDFNTRMSRESYRTMYQNTSFENLNDLVPEEKQLKLSTTHAYPGFDETLGIWNQAGTPAGAYGNSLDYIFAYSEARSTYEVAHIGMLEEEYAFLTSDHSPIFADITFTASAPVKN